MRSPVRVSCLLLMMLLPFGAVADQLRFMHTDLQGNVVAVTDESGAIVERYSYEPYGLPSDPALDGPGYTGHVHDADTGLIYMQQRYYDPEIGRFLSVDPDPVDPATAWNFNRYNYAANNPYKFVDRDGREAVCLFTATSCGMKPMTPELREAQYTIAKGMIITAGGLALLAVPDPTDLVAIGSSIRLMSSTARTDRLLESVGTWSRTKGPTKIGEKSGGYNQANKDFDDLRLDNVSNIQNKSGDVIGRTGTTSDSRRVTVRKESTDGRPTLEVRRPNGRGEEIRYKPEEVDR